MFSGHKYRRELRRQMFVRERRGEDARRTDKLILALVRALKEVFGRHRSQPIERVINLINSVLRGWVNYFAVGHSSECFSFIKDWVEKKVRRHLAHAQKRKGFGWERWNRRWLYDTLGLFNAYRVRRDGPKVAPAG
jgi:RNA-directed DNA polymerase